MTTDKTPATLAVDVLAVMDREVEEARKRVPFMHPEGPQNAEHQREYEDAGDVLVQLREARAAVAELIEADEEYNRAREAWLASPGEHDDFQAARDAWERRAAALARVKGESA